jgi:ADP-ribose pyrophosphatase YjhB (NUDIX family)
MSVARFARYCPRCGAALHQRERFGRVRPVCAVCDYTVFFDPKVAVVAFVVEDSAVLMVKRAHDPAKGLWALPAGFVDPDEDPAAAAARETLEETGVEVAVERLVTLLHRPDEGGLADLVIAYTARPVGGMLQAGDDAEDVGWFRRDALPAVALATTRRLLDMWARGEL